MNNVFTLKNKAPFNFKLSEDGKTYTMKPFDQMSFEEAELVRKAASTDDWTVNGPMVKELILKQCPELEKEGIGDMVYVQIFQAYSMSGDAKTVGESKA